MQGDLTTLLNSGYTTAKSDQPAPAITYPQDLLVENGINSGEVITSVRRVAGAKAYMHQYTLAP